MNKPAISGTLTYGTIPTEDLSVVTNADEATTLFAEQPPPELTGDAENLEETSADKAEIQLSMPENASAAAGSIVRIPVLLANEAGKPISAYSFAVRFDPNVLQPETAAIETAESLSSNGFMIAYDANTEGRIGVAAISLNNSVSATGTLLYLRFRVVGAAATALSFERTAQNKNVFEDNFGNKMSSTSTNGSFTATIARTNVSINVSGRVTTADWRGIRNVQVSLADESCQARIPLTSAFGYYRFANVPVGLRYTISVSAKKYVFSQQSQTLLLSSETDGINFVSDF